MKYSIEATIPVVQYGNIKPLIEVDSPEQEEEALRTIKRLWDKFGESPIKEKTRLGKRIETFTGEVVYFDKESHVYTDEHGKQLLSGSKYAEQESPKFDVDMMAPKTANAWEIDERALRDIWNLNSQISNEWGSAIHSALEVAHKYYDIGAKIAEKKKLDENYILPKNPFLRDVVTSFVEQFGHDAEPEVVVSDVANGMVGTIDRLSISGYNVHIGDYKTNNEMDPKKLSKYQKQLSYYAKILSNKGYIVDGLTIFYLDGEAKWSKVDLDVLPVSL